MTHISNHRHQRTAPNQESTIKDVLTTIEDVLTAVNTFASHVDTQFARIDDKFASINDRFADIDREIAGIKATMVTKDYLDEKLFDLKGELITIIRKEDRKFGALTQELRQRKGISEAAAKRILALEPFPQ